MDSSSRDTVLKIFELIIRLKSNDERWWNNAKFNWTAFHLSVVHDYVLKLSLDTDFRVLISVVKLHEERRFGVSTLTTDASSVVSFARELKRFFVVPKQHQLFERDEVVGQNELVAAFISLLLQLLQCRTGSVNSVNAKIDCLEKELRFLLTIVGDILMIHDGHEQVQNLFAEIEAMVNEAGSLVHSIVFSAVGDPIFGTIDERLGILLEHMDSFKDNVIKFLNQQPVIAETNTTPKTAAVGSPFIVESLIYDLEDLLKQEDNMIADLKDQLKVLQQELKFLQSLIEDMKASRYPEAEELKEPVVRITDVAYEAEYLINSFLAGYAPLRYFSIRLSHVLHKIKLLKTGIQGIKKNYDVDASKVAKNFSAQLSLQNKRSSEVDDIIVGLEDKEIDILNHLEGGEEHLQIIGIFGMPGVGKTTLAKKLYNHPMVKDKFDRCSWCIVSQTYHRKNLLIDILVSLKSEHEKDVIPNPENLEEEGLVYKSVKNLEEEDLVEKIYKSLKGRRFLIVMDDIWSSNAWDDLLRCFPDDGEGSRILFTSRSKDVAPSHSIIYELPCMSDEQCWELLEKKVLQNECCPQLLEIGKKIAAKCGGLPLAVVVIAGILSSMDKEESTWKNVEGNLASFIFSDQENSMMQILELSYKHLPDHLKPCFLYLGAFKDDMKIHVRTLKWLWIAEGLIHKKEEKRVESVAEEYLKELIDKNLVIVAERRSDGGVKSCIIHDLLRDLCLKRCEEENFLKWVDKNYIIYEKHHRLLVHDAKATTILLPFGLHVRSVFGRFSKSEVSNMKLRVLNSLIIQDNHNLDHLKLLVHLRYLVMKASTLDNLAWIDSLVNLEFLVVESLGYGLEIPSVILKMMKLKYFNFIDSSPRPFEKKCNSLRTNNLEFLGYVRIGSLKDEEILKCSPRLRKLKCECELYGVKKWLFDNSIFRYPDFAFFTQLESLNLSFSGARDDDLYMAPPYLPLSLKKLTLRHLYLCWTNISIIGRLPNLQVLKLMEDAFEGEIWATRDGEFQQLTFLKLEGLDLIQWNVPCSQHFPKLRHLVLDSCQDLEEIPSEVGEIVTLQLIELKDWCQRSLAASAQQIEQEQRDNGNEEFSVCLENVRQPYRKVYRRRY